MKTLDRTTASHTPTRSQVDELSQAVQALWTSPNSNTDGAVTSSQSNAVS